MFIFLLYPSFPLAFMLFGHDMIEAFFTLVFILYACLLGEKYHYYRKEKKVSFDKEVITFIFGQEGEQKYFCSVDHSALESIKDIPGGFRCSKCKKAYFIWTKNPYIQLKNKSGPDADLPSVFPLGYTESPSANFTSEITKNLDVKGFISNIEHYLFREKNYALATDFAHLFSMNHGENPHAWEYKAITHLFTEINPKRQDLGKNYQAMILAEMKSAEMQSEEISLTAKTRKNMAYILFLAEKKRFDASLKARVDLATRHKSWSKKQRDTTKKALRTFLNCYYLYPDIDFLKTIINELTTERKWILRKDEQKILDMPACEGFKAKELLEIAVELVKQDEENYGYLPPDIVHDYRAVENLLQKALDTARRTLVGFYPKDYYG